MLKKILLALAVLIAVFLIVAAFQPSEYSVARSITIATPPDEPFARTNDLRQYQLWNPWGKLDLAAKYTHAGPPSGPGASLAWAGNSSVGEGKMTILESQPDQAIKMRLDFLKPFESTATTEFTFKKEGASTIVTWSMSGEKNFLSKAMCLIMSMDKMIGGPFEEGLAGLKSLSESAKKK